VTERDGSHDFDFLNGTWLVKHRRLRVRFAGCTEWDEFDSTQWARPLFGGAGQIDETTWEIDGKTLYGCTLRLYDPAARQWSLNWSDSVSGRLYPPMIGRFGDNGIGLFGGTDICNGRSVLSRFTWSGIGATTACWEQAFSADGGVTWETNWYMDSFRTGDWRP